MREYVSWRDIYVRMTDGALSDPSLTESARHVWMLSITVVGRDGVIPTGGTTLPVDPAETASTIERLRTVDRRAFKRAVQDLLLDAAAHYKDEPSMDLPEIRALGLVGVNITPDLLRMMAPA